MPYVLNTPKKGTRPYTDEELANLDQQTLLGMRRVNSSQPDQNLLANYEHRAFARETVAEDPLMAPLLGVAIPAYSIAKALPKSLTGNRSRSEPSLEQVRQGFNGIGDGMRSWFK